MNFRNKKGVSLVTVLLFMLVATIAATATYKWLNSENKSSASRMLMSEADQAALAGIESARSWMAFHGNETGALVKQYFENDKKPVVLDDILNPLNDGKQNYKVSIVGVDATGTTYKIKLTSVGTSRNGAKSSISAILKVTGLYRVKVPSVKSDVDYKYAYFGGSIHYQGDGMVTSMVVNGDWSGNPPSTTEGDFVITGNASLSGSNISIASAACIGGNLSTNNGFNAQNLYVSGNTTDFNGTIEEDAYFNGNLNLGNTAAKAFTVGRNMTLNGTFTTKQNTFSHTVKGNMCFEASAKLIPDGTNNPFVVEGGVWMPGHNQVAPYSANYDRLVFGNKSGAKVYIADGHAYDEYVSLRNSKEFTEKNNLRSFCNDGKKISDQDSWDIVVGNGGADNVFHSAANKNICGSWGTPAWKSSGNTYYQNNQGYYVYYSFDNAWETWKGTRYKPYQEVSSQSNMYYFYNQEGQTDVEFREEQDASWRFFTGNVYANENEIRLEYTRDVGGNRRNFKPTAGGDQMVRKFSTSTPIGSYYVGGKRLNDGRGNKNFLNHNGSNATGSPYCKPKSVYAWSVDKNDGFRPECGVTPWFKSLGEVSNILPGENPLECANSVKAHCDSIWTPGSGCDGSKYKVPDPLKTAYSEFEKYANNLKCSKDLKQFDNNSADVVVNALNSCYSSTVAKADSAAKLYNGFLVVKFTNNGNATPKTPLNGKFIIIYEDKATGPMKLPPSKGVTMIYLKNGAADIRPATCDGEKFNYFIYTEQNVDLLGNFSETSCQLNGSVYASAENCAKVANSQGNAGEFIHYDENVISSLTGASVVCASSGTSCGGASGGVSGTVTSTTFNGYDTDYIATGAQLRIEMESQYKNEEVEKTDAQDVAPSIVVLPRIVYLNKDAVGTLSDYFTVKAMNGAAVSGNGSVSCPSGAPPTTGPLVAADTLRSGYYKCTYREGNYASDFYVVVTGLLSETPSVSIKGPQDVEWTTDVPHSDEVYLYVPAVSGSATTQFSVDIKVSNGNMDGWTITEASGNLVKQAGSSGDDIYTYTGTASSVAQSIHIFDVSTTVGARAGSVSFILQTPLECTITAPMVKYFSIHGTATVKRKNIEDYCDDYPESCPAESELAKARNVENCASNSIWIEAQPDCTPKAGKENDEWACKAGNGSSNPITLQGKAYDSKYCQLYIPSENNSIVGAKDDNENMDGGYILYGSLKKKRFNVHVNVEGTNSGRVIVSTRDNDGESFTQIGTCSDYNDGCDFSIYVDKQVQLKVDPNGDKFSYWTCSGAYCGKPNYEATAIEFVMSGDYTFTALFNERDNHCFYTDFNSVYAFCNNNQNEDCIDKCASGTHCSIGNGAYGDVPKWLMTYANQKKSGWSEPTFKDGYISYDGGNKNVNSNDGYQGLVLNRAVAGSNGTLTARIKTDASIGLNKQNVFLNSGFVLRSNADASEYIMLNIYGRAGLKTYARICYGNGQALTSSNTCVEKPIKTSGLGTSPDILNSTVIDLSINMNGNNIHVDFNYRNSALSWINASADFDLAKDWSFGTLADPNHQYVGFKISDPEFQLGDIGWKADDFSNEACFDYPSIDCSFAANYLGGLVPLDEEVKPWVGFSSWFADKTSCTTDLKFYYNGCDVPSNYYSSWLSGGLNNALCADISSEGFYETTNIYGQDGLKLKSDTYRFKYAGPHGYDQGSGIVRNASVAVNCEGKPLDATCGYFMVGTLQECSKNEFILSTPMTVGTAQETIELASAVNLRASSLIFSVDGFDADGYIDVILEDDTGKKSPKRSVEPGIMELDVNEMSTTIGFNPEKIKKIYLTGYSSYTVKSITSSCPNAVSIRNCQVSYSGSVWNLSSVLGHPESAAKCLVVPNPAIPDYEPSFVTCGNGTFGVDDGSFFNRLNSSFDESVSYDFTIKVFGNADDEITSEPAASCVATSATFKHGKVSSCNISSSDDVVQGAQVPQLSFSIENCPDCAYEVKLSDGTVRMNDPVKVPSSGTLIKDWQPSVNVGEFLPVGSYYYTVRFVGPSGTEYQDNTCMSPSFNVVKAQEATGECSISGDYLNVSVTGANSGSPVPVTLVYSDPLGITLNFNTISMNSTQTQKINLAEKITTPGTYSIDLKVNEKTVPCGSYTVNNTSSSSSSAVVSSSSAGGNLSPVCGISTNTGEISGESKLYDTQHLYFVFKNNTNEASTYSVDVYKDGSKVASSTINNYSNWNNYDVGTLSVGSYSFDLKYNGTSICSKDVSIESALVCSTDKSTIGIGDSFTLTTTYAGSCWSSSLTGNGVPSANCGTSYVVTPTSVGTHTYTYSVTGGDKGNATCEQTVNVVEKAPTCSVGDMTKAVGASVTISPSASTGCTNGPCSYTVTGGTKGGTSGSGYYDSDASLGNPMSGETVAGNVNYTLTLSNSAGDGSCNFKVNYTEGATCSCASYCSSGCDALHTGNVNDQSFNGCMFITDATRLSFNTDGGGWWKINGTTMTEKQACWDNAGACSSFLNNYPRVDGGWYIQSSVGWASVKTSNASNPCASGGGSTPSSSSAATPGSSASGGEISVSFTYGETGNTFDFVPGNIYKIEFCTAGKTSLICAADKDGKELYVNGTKAFTSQNWQDLGNYQSAGANCVAGNKITVTGGTVRCRSYW